jgi:hypothetical protein
MVNEAFAAYAANPFFTRWIFTVLPKRKQCLVKNYLKRIKIHKGKGLYFFGVVCVFRNVAIAAVKGIGFSSGNNVSIFPGIVGFQYPVQISWM